MTTYIVLVNRTERGIQQVKDSPRRLDAAKKMLKQMGGEIKSVYLNMGECDLVVVCEASDDAVAASKPGELEAVRNDSGIIFVKNRPYILSVMTTYLRDEKEGQAAIRKIAGLTYSYFDRLARASEYGRVVSPK